MSEAPQKAGVPAHQTPLDELIHHTSAEVLRQAASDPGLNEDLALALLERLDLPQSVLEDLSKNSSVMKHRKVIVGIVRHPHTPRYVSLPIARRLYTFELMQIALTPAVPADVKRAADEVLTSRLETISAGERLSLAKRGSGLVAAALLTDAEPRIVEAALLNPQMTEAPIVAALRRKDVPPALVEMVARHPKWSLRHEVQIALLLCPYTPLARVLAVARNMPTPVLRDLLHYSRLSQNVKTYLEKELEERGRA